MERFSKNLGIVGKLGVDEFNSLGVVHSKGLHL
jgi:hypothetical protein